MVRPSDYLSTTAWKELVVESVYGRPTQVFRERPRHVLDLLDIAVAAPRLDILVQGERRIAYGDFLLALESGAAQLHAAGVAAKDLVLIVLYNSVEFLLAQWACWRAGAIPVLGNRWWSEQDLANVIGQYQPKVVITDMQISAVVASRCSHLTFATLVQWWAQPVRVPGVLDPRLNSVEDDVALIEFTAGSSGIPKGVKLSHRNLVWTQQTLHVMRGQRPPAPTAPADQKVALMTTPMFHNGAVVAGLSALLDGNRMVILRGKFDPQEVLELIQRERVSSWNAVPTMIGRVLNHPNFLDYDLSSLTNLSTGGSMVPQALVERVKAQIPRLAVNFAIGYGMTEMSFLTIAAVGQLESRPGAVGKTIPGVEMRIDTPDENGVGELLARSGALMVGYVSGEEDPVSSAGWYHTGDLGRIDADGFVFVTGRVRDTINRGGEKVSCPRVEAVISSHSEVVEVAVIGCPDKEFGECVVAVVHLRPGATVNAAGLADYARQQLAYFEIPSRWLFPHEPLPLLPTGKIDKRQLRKNVIGEKV